MTADRAGPVPLSTAGRIWSLLVERAEQSARRHESAAIDLERLAAVRTDDQSWRRAVDAWRSALSARTFADQVASLAARLNSAR